MHKKYSLAKYIVIFVFVQLTWLAVMGLWIARYVVSHVTFREIGRRYAIQIESGADVAMLVIGLVLIAGGVAGISIMFRYLNLQFRQTRLYDNFIASITHELKTPLASIRLYIDTLDRYPDITLEQTKEFLTQMRRETARLDRMIGSVLEVDRLESGCARYHCTILEADETLKSLFEELRLQFSLSPEQVRVTGNLQSQIVLDATALRIVFENLFENSRRYTADSVRIEISLTETGKSILITIRDHGAGVPHKELKKVFKKFYRVTDPQIPSVKGTGLGLYLVKGIIAFHGGEIRAELPTDGKGLIMRIELPA
ncbi:MAG: HAMP domain-containing sensor histidine kinase, partial [Candidatus Marinimicrobia bacterium]|nr:HAMP domain-containing sensor histidine kinase [Candidatus Neomarinimicrobiota bacterium]